MKIAASSFVETINSNYHAYLNAPSVASAPFIECGLIPQQRYRLTGQSQIHQISVSAVERVKPTIMDDRTTSSDESPADVLIDSNIFEVIAVGTNPYLTFYEISRESTATTPKSLAFSVAKSLYGAVRSLAGYDVLMIYKDSWGWNQAEKESTTPIPPTRKASRRQEIIDVSRDGLSIWTQGKYGVVADSLSRIVLFDIEQGMVLKIWKGY